MTANMEDMEEQGWSDNMATLNNFVTFLGPKGQSRWYFKPQIFIAEETTPAELQATVNAWLDSLAVPIVLDAKYEIVSTEYSKAQLANNEITNSALIHYNVWERF